MSSDAPSPSSPSFQLRVPPGVGGGKAKPAAPGDADAGGVRRNAKGGVFVAPHELHQAFEFFDVEGKGETPAGAAAAAATAAAALHRGTVADAAQGAALGAQCAVTSADGCSSRCAALPLWPPLPFIALPCPGFITLGDLKKRLGVFYQVSHASALQCVLGTRLE
jgi:hypothetical protein